MICRFSSDIHDQMPCRAILSNSGRSDLAASSANKALSNVAPDPEARARSPPQAGLRGVKIRSPKMSLIRRGVNVDRQSLSKAELEIGQPLQDRRDKSRAQTSYAH